MLQTRLLTDFPILSKTTYIPSSLIKWKGFSDNYQDKTCHFFIMDHKFNALWTQPKTFIKPLSKYHSVITPDFSIYLDMPFPEQIWNTYRNRWLGYYWQRYGLTVIPSVSWSDYDSFSFCFSGIEKGSVVAISTTLIRKSDLSLYYFYNGLSRMMEILCPYKVLCYGFRFQKELSNKYPNQFVFYPYQKNDWLDD